MTVAAQGVEHAPLAWMLIDGLVRPIADVDAPQCRPAPCRSLPDGVGWRQRRNRTRVGAKVTDISRDDGRIGRSRKPRVALFAAPESSPAILFGLYDVLGSVGAVYPDMTTGAPGDALIDVRIVGASSTPFRCFGNVLVEPHGSIDDDIVFDAVVVCDLYTPITTAPRDRFDLETAWLRRMHAAGALITSVCTGSLLLAEAGLVDGRRCAGIGRTPTCSDSSTRPSPLMPPPSSCWSPKAMASSPPVA